MPVVQQVPEGRQQALSERLGARAEALQAAPDPQHAAELLALLDELAGLGAAAFEQDPTLYAGLQQALVPLASLPPGALEPGQQAALFDQALACLRTAAPSLARDQVAAYLAYLRSLHAAPDAGRGILSAALRDFPLDSYSKPHLLLRLAELERGVELFGDCLTHLERARALIEAPSFAYGENLRGELLRVHASCSLRVQLSLGQTDQAAESLLRLRQAAQQRPDDSAAALEALIGGAELALAQLNLDSARNAQSAIRQALGLPEAFSSLPGARTRLRAFDAQLSELCADLEQSDASEAHAQLEALLLDPELETQQRSSIEQLLVRADLNAGRYEQVEKRLQQQRERLELPGAAPTLDERAGLLASSAQLALLSGAPHEQLAVQLAQVRELHERFLTQWQSAPRPAGGVGFLGNLVRRDLLGTLIDLLLAVEGDERGAQEAVERLSSVQGLGMLARELGSTHADLAQIRAELLPMDVGLLLYLPGARSTHLFVIDAEQAQHVSIDWRYLRQSEARRFEQLCSSSPAAFSATRLERELEELSGLSQALGERLLPPSVRARLAGWRGVYVCGAELLGNVPFEALECGGGRLGERMALAHLPSLPVGLALERARRGDARDFDRAPQTLLLVAAPELSRATLERWPATAVPLPIDALLPVLTQGVPKDRLRLALRADAQFEALGAPALLPALITHLCVHGVQDFTQPLPGGLALAPGRKVDGLAWSEDLAHGRIAASPLVLLSVCGAARGPLRVGEDGTTHLGGAFFSSGARCLVLARGSVALDASAELMGRVQGGVLRGASPAAAMRAARVELIALDARYAHPFYSCSLQVVGLGLRPLLDAH